MAGARWVQREILDPNSSSGVKVYAIWFNMIWTDSRSFWRPNVLSDSRVVHLWDRKRIVGRWYARNTEGVDPGAVMWDVYFLYSPEARWERAPTHLVSWGGTILETRDELKHHFLSFTQTVGYGAGGGVPGIAAPEGDPPRKLTLSVLPGEMSGTPSGRCPRCPARAAREGRVAAVPPAASF